MESIEPVKLPRPAIPDRAPAALRLRYALVLLATLTLAGPACDASPSGKATGTTTDNASAARKGPVHDDAPTRPTQVAWVAPAALDLGDTRTFTRHTMQTTEPELLPPCHELFEPDGTPQPWPWVGDTAGEARALFGCRPEAYEKAADGRRLVAYGVAPERGTRGQDQRLVAYDAAGKVRWHRRIDRSAQAANFEANYRGAFVARASERITCVGTLWEGGTQVGCFEDATGEPIFSDMLPFWSGVPLLGGQNSLYGADINGLTRRYPYTGVEMRHRPFEAFGESSGARSENSTGEAAGRVRGGRGALYAAAPGMAEGEVGRLYFAPGGDHAPALTAYDFATMRPLWSLELPGRPLVTYRHVFPAHELLVIKIGSTVYGIDTARGTPRWALEVGVDHPPIAASPEHLYLLLRREERANMLFALDPTDGQVAWAARTPGGTLDVGWHEGTLLLRSVRAVREVVRHSPQARP